MNLYELIENAALKKIRDFHYTIQGFDIEADIVKKANENIESANLKEFISVKNQDFFTSKKETERSLFVVFNPPYDERIQVDAEKLYASIGTTLKHKYSGTQAWMITSNMEDLKHVGLRPSRRIKLYNGKLESKLVRYDMYEGSKKTKKNL